MQLDYDALLVLEIGDGAALDDRHAGGDRRIVAGEIRRTGEIIDFTLGVDSSSNNVRDRYARRLKGYCFWSLLLYKSAVSPGYPMPTADRAAAIPHVARGYRSGCNGGAASSAATATADNKGGQRELKINLRMKSDSSGCATV